MSSRVIITPKPVRKQLNEIEIWLIEEEKTVEEGFYCNWNIIENAFEEKRMFVISANNSTVGFLVWHHSSDLTIKIDIAEIKPDHRRKGLLKHLTSYVCDFFMAKSVYVVELQCAPASSETVWKKIGFMDFPATNGRTHWDSDNKRLYKTLFPTSEYYNNNTSSETLSLWNDEPYRTENVPPNWSWKLDFIDDTAQLRNPIVHPCLNDWKISWKKDATIVKEDKAKYFIRDIVHGNFLILRNLDIPTNKINPRF